MAHKLEISMDVVTEILVEVTIPGDGELSGPDEWDAIDRAVHWAEDNYGGSVEVTDVRDALQGSLVDHYIVIEPVEENHDTYD